MRISVAMCTFNGDRFLPEQLTSIATQKRLPDELIVCDDGSSDHSLQLVEEFARRVPFPVHLTVNECTLGSTRNFQKAISLCACDVVALADQDDVWYPHKLAHLEQVFLTSPAVVAAFSDADVIDCDSQRIKLRLWQAFAFGSREQRRFAAGQGVRVLIKHPVVTGATLAFRRPWIDILMPIPESDVHDRWISFLLAACGPFARVKEPLMQYRRHTNQQIGLSTTTLPERLARAYYTKRSLYQDEIERFRQLHARLAHYQQCLPNAGGAMAEIERKISHLEHRIQLQQQTFSRVPKVIREIFNHGYWRYAAGWESVAKDLFLYNR